MSKEKMCDDLQELTGQESGIVVYEGRTAVICNWSSIKGFPRVFATGLIGMGEEILIVTGEHSEDLFAEIFCDVTEVIDMSAEQEEEWPESGTVYYISDSVMVITPDDWC